MKKLIPIMLATSLGTLFAFQIPLVQVSENELKSIDTGLNAEPQVNKINNEDTT
jgi:hypothetical protein